MRCPKCHYISFGSVDRCRNCGYELALAPDTKPVDLPIQNPNEPIGPLSDFALSERAPGRPSANAADEQSAGARVPATAARFDLPLFSGDAPDDAPLVTPSAIPRTPLSVRRGQPAIPKARSERTGDNDRVPRPQGERAFRLPPVEELEDAESIGAFRSEGEIEAAPVEPATSGVLVAAPVFARLLAGTIDVLTLLAIDAAVLFFTLRVLNLSFDSIRVLPPVPLAVFLLLLNGGYLAGFTAAGGQTIGKMIAGIRVVAERHEDADFDSGQRVTLGAAVLRAAAYLVSLLPAGLGFLPILLDSDGRALHDRLADTRVVKA